MDTDNIEGSRLFPAEELARQLLLGLIHRLALLPRPRPQQSECLLFGHGCDFVLGVFEVGLGLVGVLLAVVGAAFEVEDVAR